MKFPWVPNVCAHIAGAVVKGPERKLQMTATFQKLGRKTVAVASAPESFCATAKESPEKELLAQKF